MIENTPGDFQYTDETIGTYLTEEKILQYSRGTAKTLLKEAIADIDSVLGVHTAEANPELVSGLLQARMLDIHGMTISIALQMSCAVIDSALNEIWKNQ